jgi:hypothetical protein
MAFAFDRAVWEKAVVADVWSLTLLLFAIVVCLMMRWHFAPDQRRYLYAAVFFYALGLCNSQALAVAAAGFLLMIFFADTTLGRDAFIATTLLIAVVLVVEKQMDAVTWSGFVSTHLYSAEMAAACVGLFMLLASVVLIIKTRAGFTRWREILACGFFLVLGLIPYLFIPISSMTNPPVNQGYPRTVDGFFHVVTRGQYDRIYGTESFERFWPQIGFYLQSITEHFGLVYVVLAIVPFFFAHRMSSQERRWMCGMMGLFFCVSYFWLIMMNPGADRASVCPSKQFFAPSHLILAAWAGYGLVLLGMHVTKPSSSTR